MKARIDWRIGVIAFLWWLGETSYFGWNAMPGSVAELFADFGAFCLWAFAFYAGRSSEVTVNVIYAK